ncbi:unnamed protein product [Pylaiella littoralis]
MGRPRSGLKQKLMDGEGTRVRDVGRTGDRQADVFETRYGYSWDLCMIFPTEPPEGVPHASEIIRRLHNAGLETFIFHSVQMDEIICKIRAPLERLATFASEVEYLMLFDEPNLKRAVERGSDEPLISGRHITHDPTITMYRPHEYVYGKYSTSKRLAHLFACKPGMEHPFSSVHRIKLLRRMVESTQADGCGINISVLMRNDALKAFFPFHDNGPRDALFSKWVARSIHPIEQPLDEAKDYVGEKIAMYFALLGHYTTWLGPLSILGVIMSIDQILEWDLDAILAPYFAVFVSFWAVLMLEFWKRREAELAMRWGMSEFEAVEHDRPEFKGDAMVSFVDGSPMTYYPPEEYYQLLVVANTLVVGMIILAIALITGIFSLAILWDESNSYFLYTYGSYVSSFLLSMEIQIMNFVYKKVAIWTTERENHRTDTVFEDMLIAKLAIFQFVNSYASLFYIAFVQPFTTECTYASCLDNLCQSLAIIFCTRLLIANTMEIYLPRFQMRRKEKKEKEGTEDAEFSEAEMEYVLETYDEMMGPLGDMSEIAIQFGYVTLFVVAFPVAPLLAWISNYAEIRVDAVKILYEHRRPFPRGAQDIGTWQTVWTAVALVAVATNAGLILFTSEDLEWSMSNKVWAFVLWQYGVFGLMALFAVFVQDVPNTVIIQLGRQSFITSKVVDQIPDEQRMSQIRAAGPRHLDIKSTDDRPPLAERKGAPKFSWC